MWDLTPVQEKELQGITGIGGLSSTGPYGDVRTDPFQALPGEINYDPLDRFTFAHAASGAAMGLFRLPWWVALMTAVSWDLIERALKAGFPGWFPHYTQDTAQHVACDAAAWMLGWAVTYQLMDHRARRRAMRGEE